MKNTIIYLSMFICAMYSAKINKSADAQVQTIGTVKIADANLLADMPITEAIIQTKRVYGVDIQYFYQAVQGMPSGPRTNEYLYRHIIIPSNYSPGWYWTTLKVPVDAMNVMNLDSVNTLFGFDKQSRALAAEDALRSQIAAIPAGATGAQGIQGVTGSNGIAGTTGAQGLPGTPATPNTASTPLSIAGNNISIQTASGSQSGALSASDWKTFNNKLSSFTETDPTVSATIKAITPANIATWNDKSYASLTGKPTLFDGQYSSLTGKPMLFDGNYNSLTNLPTLFTASQANLLYRPITYVPSSTDITTALGYTPYNGATNPNGYVGTSALAGYQPLITGGTTAQYYRGDKTFQTLNTLAVPELTNLYFTDVRARSAISGLANGGITYNSATGEVSQTTPTYNNAPGRTVNTSFKASAVRPVRVSYTVSIATTLSLLNLNSSGKADLQISSDGTNWITVSSAGITRTLAVSISVGLNDTSLLNLQGEIPTNFFCRVLTTVSGGGVVSVTGGQEVQY